MWRPKCDCICWVKRTVNWYFLGFPQTSFNCKSWRSKSQCAAQIGLSVPGSWGSKLCLTVAVPNSSGVHRMYLISPITCRAEYTLQGTCRIAICSIRTNFRCIHSNTRTSKACVTWLTIEAAFCIRICAIRAKNVFFKCLDWTVCSFGASCTISTASWWICPSQAFHTICFAFTTKNASMNWVT